MRKFLLLLGLLLWAACSAAQSKVDLTPQRMVIYGDTFQCFTLIQAQEIAKRITQLQYRNAKVVNLEALLREQETMLLEKDAVIRAGFQKVELVEQKLAGRDELLAGQEELIREQARQIQLGEQQIRKLRRKGRLWNTVGTIVITTLTLLHVVN